MPYLWGPSRALRLAAVLATTVSASSIRRNLLFERAESTCAAADFSRCSQPEFPDNFCCESGATCIALAGNTTVLCCPKGSNCDKISPITCDISLQDAATNPAAEIKTTALDGTLETCGASSCCPFGYHCDGKNCVINADQSAKPGAKPSSTSTSSAVPTPSSAPSPTSSSTSGSASESSTTVAVSGIATSAPPTVPPAVTPTDTPAPSTESTADTVKIVAGVIGGVVGLVLIIVVVVLTRFRRRQKLKKEELQSHESSSSFGNIISAPVPHATYPNQRLDFLAKRSQSTSTKSFAASSPTAVASPPPPPHRQQEYGGFMPPNSPYSPYARRPDSEMSDVPRSYHASAEISGLRNLTQWRNLNNEGDSRGGNANNLSPDSAPLFTVTPPRDDSVRGKVDKGKGKERARGGDEGEDINIFADPFMMGGGGRPESAVTTWSNIQQRADSNSNASNNNNNTPRGQARLGDQLPRWR